jgi:hypothetical protein
MIDSLTVVRSRATTICRAPNKQHPHPMRSGLVDEGQRGSGRSMKATLLTQKRCGL